MTENQGNKPADKPEAAAKRAASSDGGHRVSVAPGFGSGEVAVPVGEGETFRVQAGAVAQVDNATYEKLPKDEEGNLAYPLADVKEGE